MTKPLAFILLVPIGLASAADPDIQRVLDDALKRFPPGDYQHFVPRLVPEMERAVAETLRRAPQSHPAGTVPWLREEVSRLNGTLPELPAVNPFERPLQLFQAPASPSSAR